ncbi:MAG TPA: WYL domain-containing protein [Candidatus Dormibacteraeota bacterium]|jgi:predicted DNA-binding transcriptional regulator YafY|nr:WYL domain-containing protein [Candidatus Dormibacteraeota bacterium]
MRADRLVATLLVLQARGRVTAAEVAAELEVSERTARRDLEALSASGVPVYSQQGRGGGWSLIGGARTDLTGLTAEEARALFLVAGPASGAPSVRNALRKLVRALPDTFRADAEAASAAILVDPTSWGGGPAPPPPPHLEPLQRAVIEGVRVRLRYAARGRNQDERTVDPLGLVAKGHLWYLLAGTDRGLRTFRVDRVGSVEATIEPVARPGDFDLDVAWRSVIDELDRHRLPCSARLRVEPGLLHVLGWIFGSAITAGESGGDGPVEVVVRGASHSILASQLAGLGSAVDVLEPEEVRRHLGRIGAELVERYRLQP